MYTGTDVPLTGELVVRNQLAALDELTAELATVLTELDVARIVVERGRQVMGADTCTLHRLSDQDGALDLVDQRGVAAAVVEQIRRIEVGSANPVARTVETGAPLFIETEAEYAAIYPALAAMRADGPRARAFWSVPLVAEVN